MKNYRCYYNRASEAPQVWSIDEGTQASEINVSKVVLLGCDVTTGCDLSETDVDNKPKAWIEVTGWLTLDGGTAIIRGQVGRTLGDQRP